MSSLQILKDKTLKRYEAFLNKYEFIGKIGEGAYGVVRKACHKNNPSQFVAIKSFKLRIARDGEGVPLTVCREINVTHVTWSTYSLTSY
jgi:serine/threonine protein kinase